MGEHGLGSPGPARAWWLAALVVVPTALAGLALQWPGPQLADDLRARSAAALASAGLGAVAVAVSGRDAQLTGVPRGAEQAAVDTVSGVTGIRAVTVVADGPGVPAAEPTPITPTASPSAATRQQLVDQISAVLAAAPITFGPDSAELRGTAAATVKRVAELLVAQPTARVDVDGFVADTPGGPELAQRLSDDRAVVVADTLVAGGVDRSRITARGRGATRPLDTPAASRRVEISVS